MSICAKAERNGLSGGNQDHFTALQPRQPPCAQHLVPKPAHPPPPSPQPPQCSESIDIIMMKSDNLKSVVWVNDVSRQYSGL